MKIPESNDQGGTQEGLQGVDPFMESAFFEHCLVKNEVSRICEECKPGRTFLAGSTICA